MAQWLLFPVTGPEGKEKSPYILPLCISFPRGPTAPQPGQMGPWYIQYIVYIVAGTQLLAYRYQSHWQPYPACTSYIPDMMLYPIPTSYVMYTWKTPPPPCSTKSGAARISLSKPPLFSDPSRTLFMGSVSFFRFFSRSYRSFVLPHLGMAR